MVALPNPFNRKWFLKKMFSPSLLKKLLQKSELVGAYIDQIFDEEPETFWFKTSAKILYLSCEREFPFLAFTEDRGDLIHPDRPSPFCELLRRYLRRGKILRVEQPLGERLVTLQIERYEEGESQIYSLVAELIPKRANLLILSEKDEILGLLHSRKEKGRILQGGELYIPPPPPRVTTSPVSDREPVISWESLRDHQKEVWARNFRQEKLSHLRRDRKKNRTNLRKVEEEWKETEKASEIQRQGELLKTSYHLLKRGMKEITVVDYYQEPSLEISIPLDPVLSPQENIEKIFKKARKLTRGRQKLQERREEIEKKVRETEEKIAFWEGVSREEILSLRRASLGKTLEGKGKTSSLKGSVQKSSPFREFTSLDGWAILVGKSSKDNDKLSMGTARGKDFFFHVQGFPGSHVVARNPTRENVVPQETLLDGATLAVYYSKLRGERKVEVTYTQCKNLKKPKKAPPGRVLVQSSKTVLLQWEEERIGRLLKSAGSDLEQL